MENIKVIKAGGSYIQIKREELVYLKSDDKYCKLYVTYKKTPIVLLGSFKYWSDALKDYLFTLRQGAAVNPMYVSKVNNIDVSVRFQDKDLNFCLTKENKLRFRQMFDVINEY